MKKLIMWNVITLDGYFEGETAWDLGFHQLVWGDELERYIDEQLKTAAALVFGKNTYVGMADYWQKETGDIAEQMNSIKKYACSNTLETADWNNTTIIRDAVSELAKLKNEEGEGDLFVFGSGKLSDSLTRAGLFDEYRLCVAPVILGKGKRLFAEGLPHTELSLLKTEALKSGGVVLWYARE